MIKDADSLMIHNQTFAFITSGQPKYDGAADVDWEELKNRVRAKAANEGIHPDRLTFRHYFNDLPPEIDDTFSKAFFNGARQLGLNTYLVVATTSDLRGNIPK